MAMQDCGFTHKDISRVVKISFMECLTYTHSTRLNRNIITAIISFGPTWPEAESSKGSSFQGAAFRFPQRIRREAGRCSSVLKSGGFRWFNLLHTKAKNNPYIFKGKLIVLENLIPVLSPDEKNKRKREIENHLYDVFSKYTDRFY